MACKLTMVSSKVKYWKWKGMLVNMIMLMKKGKDDSGAKRKAYLPKNLRNIK